MVEQLKVGTYPNNYGGAKLQDVVIVVNSLFDSIAAITGLAPENLDTLKEIADNFANYLTKTEAQTTYLAKTNAQSTYLAKTDLVNNLTTGGTNKALTAEQGKVLKTSIDTKINTSDIINDLTTGGATKVLSAEQGKILNTSLGNKVNKDGSKVLSEKNFTAALETKLNGIAENANNYVLPAASTSLGGVKQGVAVTDAVGGDEKDKINALLASLRTAGVIASA